MKLNQTLVKSCDHYCTIKKSRVSANITQITYGKWDVVGNSVNSIVFASKASCVTLADS